MFDTLKHTIRDWKFYRHIDNWHKHPWISAVMCKLGRHDYEYLREAGNGAHLFECFYCLFTKSSRVSRGKNGELWNLKAQR